jgi:protocatechuate 3,4-dioxygenase beta subunit
MPWLSFLVNRYVITFGGIAVLAAAWNLYVAFNDDGILAGQVVGPDGRPVPGVTVELAEKGFLIAAPKGRTTTDVDGRFRFTGHKLYRLQLEAHKEGVGRMQAKEFRLYFKGQNMTLHEPLRLQASTPAGVTPQR